MYSFDVYNEKYKSTRNNVFANRGMVCTSIPQASSVGIEIIKRGGNAIDAAVAIAAALPVLEPVSNGIGSDAFALVWTNDKLYGLNASGYSPKSLNIETVKNLGFKTMPTEGWIPTMVPGAPAAWAELSKKFGKLSLMETFSPAIDYAIKGFPVSPNVARLWENEAFRFEKSYKESPLLYEEWRKVFSKNGEAYKVGDIFRFQDFADTLTELASTNCESFYRGKIMRKIVNYSKSTGGFFEESDFTDYYPEWVEPISVNYHGFDVYEMPPNGHGITVLMALNILNNMNLPKEKDNPETWHKMIEALKLAFVDTKAFVADPRYMHQKVSDLLSLRYAESRRELIGKSAQIPSVGNPGGSDTVYFCTADNEGNMVSYIQSNYKSFGAGIVIPATGISLQNRGANFNLDPKSDNCLAGGKKSYHTIIPGFLCENGKPIGPFGVMGAFMQPQGHLQVLVNMINYGMSPQQALNAPRFQWIEGRQIQLESNVSEEIIDGLRERGHEIQILEDRISFGRGQIITKLETGVLVGGTEPRCDGSIAVW